MQNPTPQASAARKEPAIGGWLAAFRLNSVATVGKATLERSHANLYSSPLSSCLVFCLSLSVSDTLSQAPTRGAR